VLGGGWGEVWWCGGVVVWWKGEGEIYGVLC